MTSGDVAPAPVDAASAEQESAEASTAAAAPTEADADPVADAPVEADADPVDEAGPEDAPDEADPAPAAAATDTAPPVTRTPRRRPSLRRGAVALLAAGSVALGLGAFAWVAPSPERADRRFVETAQEQGHLVAPGAQQALVVSAARKICDRRFTPETVRERRATALTTDELAAVGATFGAATRDFTRLALKTYCSS